MKGILYVKSAVGVSVSHY